MTAEDKDVAARAAAIRGDRQRLRHRIRKDQGGAGRREGQCPDP
ncbi:MAG: hypothetical protein ACLU38_03300 [Dysosmobacter sp.]